ncbi:Aste57867_11741 [Aphanomyces stellatus]|uniref:Aste57867_11741 protein n=1 Tax=Aphanomyces stellatus TaxID=120398 RepID=A0A485KUZ6_9STRA|nr:hypothetical protein As57867_011697 [Aphanomyces stellatus]VFT88597.1 Aste57867_11741 [Aphanomyces stellatus]
MQLETVSSRRFTRDDVPCNRRKQTYMHQFLILEHVFSRSHAAMRLTVLLSSVWTVIQAAYPSCDANITAAAAITISDACATFMQSDTTSIVSLLQDYAANPHSIVGYFVCAAPPCASDFKAFLAGYPKCMPSNASTSYLASANALRASCRSIASTKNGTCQPTDVGLYTRARYNNPLTRACAAALTPFNITTSTQWYDAIQQANASTTTPALLEAFCTTDACMIQTNATLVSLPTCTLDSGENVHEATTQLSDFCAIVQTILMAVSKVDPTPSPFLPDAPGPPTPPHATPSTASPARHTITILLLTFVVFRII